MHIVFIALVVFVSGVSADERDGLRFIVKRNPVPGAVNNSPTPPADDLLSTQTSELKLAGAALLRFYQVFISTQDVPSCPFEPTCSEYAKQAVYTYGLLAGSIMAVDRYQRCNGLDLGIYPRDPVTGRFIDPP
ncbi:MAG: membrane protein insertion efficiency factor YidD [Spirochaetales bacterium]|nr:membrane protein insertion efficiency factor YidD [Spirochaetales bacterium]